MALTREALHALGGFRSDLTCNEDTELLLRAGRRGLRIHFDPDLVVWATDHRRLHRGMVRKSLHSLVRNVLIFAVCTRPVCPVCSCTVGLLARARPVDLLRSIPGEVT